MKKKLLSMVFVLFMLCAVMPVIANAATSGNCGANGDNVTWTLDDEGTLTINGEGDMKDYTSYPGGSYAPWHDNCLSVKKVVIDQGVTHIGCSAFYGCIDLTSITIPGSVISIGERAFGDTFTYCSGLDSVYISDLAAYLNIDFGDYNANPMFPAHKLYLNGKRVAGAVKIPDTVTQISCC